MQKSDENKILVVVAAIVVLVIGAVVWKASHRGAGLTGERSAADLEQKWTFQTGPIQGALALAEDGTLYAATEDGSLYAVDPSGKMKWRFPIGRTVEAPAIAEDGTIYVANQEQMIYATRSDGKQLWAWGGGRYANKNSPWRAAALDFDHFYTPWRGQMRAMRLSDGYDDWPAGIGFEDAGAAAILPNGLLLYPGVGRLDAVDRSAEGKTKWQYPVMDPPLTVDYLLEHNGRPPMGNFWLESGVAVSKDGTFYGAASGSRLVAITADGALKWEFPLPARSINYASPVVASDGTIYFAGDNGTVYAITSEGTQRWTLDLGAQVRATPLLTEDGTLFVVTSAAVHAISPQGKILAKAPAGGGTSSPTLAPDGTLYVASGTKIIAYSTRHGGLMKSPWPKFQHDLANTGRAQEF